MFDLHGNTSLTVFNSLYNVPDRIVKSLYIFLIAGSTGRCNNFLGLFCGFPFLAVE